MGRSLRRVRRATGRRRRVLTRLAVLAGLATWGVLARLTALRGLTTRRRLAGLSGLTGRVAAWLAGRAGCLRTTHLLLLEI